MRLTLLILLFTGVFLGKGYTQDTIPGKKTGEVHIGIQSLLNSDFTLGWKKQIKNNMFFKLGLVEFKYAIREENSSNSIQFPETSSTLSSGLLTGLEFRKDLSQSFTFFHGPDLGFTYLYSFVKNDNPTLPERSRKNKNYSYSSNIAWSFGFIFHLKSRFYLSPTISPGIRVNYREFKSGLTPANNHESVNVGFNFKNAAVISLIYRY